ncbi:hydrolase [Heyndrickxia sp. NPDC080065]|uniref:hydrolase n=1 Tax=Heyndrickxia sp. NPDC080065 TaxID=3390568 RepID=UPI003CFFBC9F
MLEKFLFDQQWCRIHYPEKPNGFAIFFIGDQQHYVNENTSFWVDNKGRAKMIDQLSKAGYLVYYSNLYEKNWGNHQSVEHSHNLYHLIMRKEILNKKIHIFAEGMGSLTAAQLIPLLKENIRSVVLFTPCISLDSHIQQEKNRKFYYKKLMKEIKIAFNNNVPDLGTKRPLEEMKQPLCLIQVIDQNRYKSQKQIIDELFQIRKENNLPVENYYILLENRLYITEKMIRFLRSTEKEL